MLSEEMKKCLIEAAHGLVEDTCCQEKDGQNGYFISDRNVNICQVMAIDLSQNVLGWLIDDSDITDEQVIRYVKDLWNIDLCKDK